MVIEAGEEGRVGGCIRIADADGPALGVAEPADARSHAHGHHRHSRHGVLHGSRGRPELFLHLLRRDGGPSNASPDAKETITATQHDRPVYITNDASKGQGIVNGPFINHTDLELALIETLVGRNTPLYSAKTRTTRHGVAIKAAIEQPIQRTLTVPENSCTSSTKTAKIRAAAS